MSANPKRCRQTGGAIHFPSPFVHLSARRVLTTSDVRNVTQGLGVLGHHMLPMGGAHYRQAFCQRFRGWSGFARPKHCSGV